MGKPNRSPMVGYNHNLGHLGRVFHVQSEDSGVAHSRLFTHLFFEGSILASRKHEYNPAEPDDRVRALMQAQHKVMIRDLMQGKLDERIIAFFAARGEHVGPVVAGAVPAAPLLETAVPAMVLPETAPAVEVTAAAPIEATAPVAPPPAADAVPVPAQVPATPEREPSGGAPGRPRRSTRPIDVARKGGAGAGGNPPQVVVRATDGRRPPFGRNGSGPVAKMASADGVVVQRSVVVGDPSGAPARPARIRPPVPYVVTGGNHTERPPRPTDAPASTQPLPDGTAPAAAAQPAPASAAPSEPHRTGTSPFGVGLAEDKSLDEVILEYLSDDGDNS